MTHRPIDCLLRDTQTHTETHTDLLITILRHRSRGQSNYDMLTHKSESARGFKFQLSYWIWRICQGRRHVQSKCGNVSETVQDTDGVYRVTTKH